jgi:hypothetical protein
LRCVGCRTLLPVVVRGGKCGLGIRVQGWIDMLRGMQIRVQGWIDMLRGMQTGVSAITQAGG